MSPRTRYLVLGAVAVVAAIAGAWVARQSRAPDALPALSAGTRLPSPRALEPFTLLDQRGAEFTLASLRGAPTLMFFGFTRCPDVCPTTLALVAAARKAANLPTLRVVLVSVDPERDTPALLASYLAAFDPSFIGLTGPVPDVTALARQLGVAAARVPLAGGDYTVDHSAALLWLDGEARLAAVFTPPFSIDTLASDLRRLGGAPR